MLARFAHMNKKLLILFGFIALIGCAKQPTFSVSGTISNANNERIYLEHTALLGTTIVDSCNIKKDGSFHLEHSAPTYPDFYRIRVKGQSLLLGIDSTEQVLIHSSIDSLAHTLNITGSETSLQMAQLRASARTATREQLQEQTKQLIIANPRSLIAYYAVFLKQNGQYIWDVTQASDRKLYQVVATSYNIWMPEYERTKVLYQQVLEYMQAERAQRNQQVMQQIIAESENTFLDITLPDNKGKQQSLSQYRGKLILLDISSTMMEQYIAYNFELRELYNKYHQRGLVIYSVAIDRNQLAWEDAVEHLPWTTVRADENTMTSVITQYNVQSLPTMFLIDKTGEIQGRYSDFKQLDSDIAKYL